jgi:hypothetical protein
LRIQDIILGYSNGVSTVPPVQVEFLDINLKKDSSFYSMLFTDTSIGGFEKLLQKICKLKKLESIHE